MKSMLNPERFVRRVFVVDGMGSILRIGAARFNRLKRHDPAVSFPEFAGQPVQFAIVDIGWYRGRPTEIYADDYEVLYFNRLGRLDRKRKAERKRLVDRVMNATLVSYERHLPFEQADHPACRRLGEQFLWKPTKAVDAEIRRLALVLVRSPQPLSRPSRAARRKSMSAR